MKYIIFISIGLGAVLLYLLSLASANTAASGSYYTVLLVLNAALALMLLVLIGIQLWNLYRKIREHVMGSRLTLRLIGAFALMAIIPGLIVYAVSVNFLTRSIESWFNVKVESALDGGLRLGQRALDIMLTDVETKAENMATNLAFQPERMHYTLMNDLREKNGVQDALLISLQGKILAVSSSDPNSFLPELPTIQQLGQAQHRLYGKIEPIPNKGLYLRVLAPVNSQDLMGETRILQLMQPVPKSLSSTAEEVQSVYQDYQELSYSRKSLQETFALTLTLVLMLAMLSAVAIAFVLSRRLSSPLMVLAEGTRAIARGDYSTMLPEHGKDELGILVKSFNSMTRQLNEATQASEKNQVRLETARSYLETVLAHLSSGVLTLNERGDLRTYNLAAANILRLDLADYVGKPFAKIADSNTPLLDFINLVLTHFDKTKLAESASLELNQQLIIFTGQGKQVLLVRATRLPVVLDERAAGSTERGGFVIVFDDVTTMAQAQRDAAWGEVARRLAHEIKNPLTPIQLSAERLQHKLGRKLAGADAEMLQRATDTIVNQVDAMKTMVNEFSEYARAPAANLAKLNLNQLIKDVTTLYTTDSNNVEFNGAANLEYGATIQLKLAANLPDILGDATMLRQVLHNLLQNAQDALKSVNKLNTNAIIIIETIQLTSDLKLIVTDNGHGFPVDVMARAFEPYVTTKSHGTGLGLAIVKKIVEEHQGLIKIENLVEGGASVVITLPLDIQKMA